jgi:hypothetical protein
MKRLSCFLLLAFILSLAVGLTIASAEVSHSHETELVLHACPICSMGGYFTGTTKTDWGHLFYLYQCPNGHTWWERVN